VRAVNTGISAIIGSNGRILELAGGTTGLSKSRADVVVGQVPLDDRASVYVRTGDWPAITAFALTVLVLLARIAVALSRRARAQAA
jgi:apolipoprotein N-acyltransferase